MQSLERWLPWFFLTLALLALLWGSGGRLLTEPDELKYLEISREMRESGRWVLPLYNNELYLDKGPLFFWLLIGSQKLFSDPMRAAVFPAQAAGLAALFLFWVLLKAWGWPVFDRLRALALLLLTLQFLILGRSGRMDSVLACFILAGYVALHLHLERPRWWTAPAFGLMLGLALLTKGPVALVWMWGVPALYAALEKNTRALRFVFHPLSLVVPVLVAGAWMIPAYAREGTELFRIIFVKQTGGRMLHSFAHAEPMYYYFLALPLVLLPFTLYFLRGLFLRPLPANGRFLLAWFWGPLVFFSLISGKISIYLQPLLPATSAFAALPLNLWAQDRTGEGRSRFRMLDMLTSMLYLLCGAGLLFARGHPSYLPLKGAGTELGIWILGAGLLLLTTTFLSPKRFFPILALVTTLIYVAPLQALLRQAILLQSPRGIAQEYARLEGTRPEGYAYKYVQPGYIYFAHRRFELVETPRDLARVLDGGHHVLLRRRDFLRLPPDQRERISIVATAPTLRDGYHIIREKE
jgi:hypothetical protein